MRRNFSWLLFIDLPLSPCEQFSRYFVGPYFIGSERKSAGYETTPAPPAHFTIKLPEVVWITRQIHFCDRKPAMKSARFTIKSGSLHAFVWQTCRVETSIPQVHTHPNYPNFRMFFLTPTVCSSPFPMTELYHGQVHSDWMHLCNRLSCLRLSCVVSRTSASSGPWFKYYTKGQFELVYGVWEVRRRLSYATNSMCIKQPIKLT